MKKLFLLFLIIIANILSAYSQDKYYEAQSKKIDSLTSAYRPFEALKLIDKTFDISNLTNKEKTDLKVQKIYVSILSDNFEKGIKLSLEVLKNKDLEVKGRIKILIYRALCFELLEQYNKCQKELQQLDALYKDFKGVSKYYAMFLYRKSSYYRVTGHKKEAYKWALKAKDYSEKYGFKEEEGIAFLLLGFLSDKSDKQLEYLNKALNSYKSLGDKRGEAYMYLNFSTLFLRENKLQKAKKQALEAVKILEGTKLYFVRADIFQHLSSVYEKDSQFDKALYYYKKYEEESQKRDYVSQKISVNLMESQHKKELDDIIIKNINSENKYVKSLNFRLLLAVILLTISLLTVIYLLSNLYAKKKKIRLQKRELKDRNEMLNESLGKKEILLQELHHRTKNNMSLVSSFIDFQFFGKKYLEAADVKAIKDRINALILVHKNILIDYDNPELIDGHCNLKDYFKGILDYLLKNNVKNIIYTIKIPKIILKYNIAAPLGIMLNEMITNTLMHSCRPDRQLKIEIKVKKQGQTIVLNYSDNGIKPKNIEDITKSTGCIIIENMVKQLRGTIINNCFDYEVEVQIKK